MGFYQEMILALPVFTYKGMSLQSYPLEAL
jgi:hypothetical protein